MADGFDDDFPFLSEFRKIFDEKFVEEDSDDKPLGLEVPLRSKDAVGIEVSMEFTSKASREFITSGCRVVALKTDAI